MSTCKYFITQALCLIVFIAGAFAQTGAGSIEGVVKDASGAVIPATKLSALRVDTNQQHETITNNVGYYLFPSLQPGAYKLAAQAPGMKPWEGTVTLRTGQVAVVDAILAVGASTTEITVAADVTPMVSAASSTLGVTVERERIEQLPLNGRNVNSMVQVTAPGLEGSTSQLSVYGLRYGSLEFVQDGASLANRSWGQPMSKPPGLDTVQEFKVETNNASARNNRPATAIMTTRSGTNRFHGALFETVRNNSIGLARRRQDYYEKAPQLARNEFGASGGGPVVIPKLYNGTNRTFIFLAYEGYALRQGSTQSTSVWTQAMREGDFSALKDASGRAYTIYDPWTTDSKTYQRVPFPNNRIPVGRRSPVASHLFSVTPLPTQLDVNPLVANNWFGPQPNKNDQHTGTLRFDHRLSNKDQVFVRYSQGTINSLANNGNAGSPITLDGATNVQTLDNGNKTVAVSWTRVFSPTFFGETLVNFASDQRNTIAGDITTNWAERLGLPNPFNKMGFPEIGQTGVGMEFRESANTVGDTTHIWNIDQNFTKVAGRHEFQFGGRTRYEVIDNYPQQQYVKGLHYYNSLATSLYDPATGSLNGAVPRSGHDSANLFLGAFLSYQVNRTRDWFHFSAHEYAGYLQDNWKLTSRLTLNLGMRLESYPIMREQDNIVSGFDPASRSIVLGRPLDELYQMGALTPGVISAYNSLGAKFSTAAQAGLPDALSYTDTVMAGPRLGFAYRLTTGARPLVIRGGYSRFAFPIHLRAWSGTARSNIPLATKYNLNLNSAAQSPDGRNNYLLRAVPPYVAGVNTKNLFDPNKPDPGTRGSFGSVYFDPYQPSSRADQWNVTLEREVLPNTVVRVALLGTHGSQLDQYRDYNEEMPNYIWFMKTGLPIPTGDYAGVARREWSSDPYGTIRAYSKSGWSNFAGFQAEVERRFSKGVGFQFFYVMSNANRAGGNSWNDEFLQDSRMFLDGAVPQDATERNRFLNYSRNTTVPKHRLRWNWIVDLPTGRGKLLGRNAGGLVNALIGGWQLAGFGSVASQWWQLPTGNWGYLGNVETYGEKYPIEDCRSGRCVPGFLYWNGYIPANRINSYDANGKPNGVMGVPADYKASNLPIWPMPADGGDPNDSTYKYIGTNTVFVKLKNGAMQQTNLDTGLHPWRNQSMLGPMLWNLDASLFKSVAITEQLRLRINADFFNVLNMPGVGTPGGGGLLSTQNSVNAPRQLQLTLRLMW